MSFSHFISSGYLYLRLITSRVKCSCHKRMWGSGGRVPLVIDTKWM